jgi:hypothetical protein
MSSFWNRFAQFPRKHRTITPDNSVDLLAKDGMIIYCGTAGTIAVHDQDGVSVTYTVLAGDILPLVVRRVLATGTTVTQVIGLY